MIKFVSYFDEQNFMLVKITLFLVNDDIPFVPIVKPHHIYLRGNEEVDATHK